MGRRASAAWAEVWMSVMPSGCRTAAVVTMIAKATTFENVMPTMVSTSIRCSARGPWSGACIRSRRRG